MTPLTTTTAPAGELTDPQQAALVRALAEMLRGGAPGGPVELVETHISRVLVAPDVAFKFKKPLDLGFLDYKTLARRRHGCDEELRLNRRLAPDLYKAVVTVNGHVDAPRLGGDGPPLDVAVQMRTFDQAGLWDRLAARGELQPSHIDELATQLDRFQRAAAVAPPDSPHGTPDAVRAPMLDNLDVLARLLDDADAQDTLTGLQRWEAAAFAALAPVFARRLAEGRVREGHGDLHLGNVAQIDGRTTVFDGIEFNASLRWIDVMSEIAFMAMDLLHRGRPALAHRFVNACVERSGDHDGVRVLRWHLVYRALVRAKVAALRAGQTGGGGDGEARAYLAQAAQLASPAPPVLAITHGFSGSGKTTLTQGLVEATGAVRIRADVERKRLFGLDAAAHSGSAPGAGLYTAAASAAVYERLSSGALAVLQGGFSVVLDATFLQRTQREATRALAASLGVRFVVLDVLADPATLRERVRRRAAQGGDASEADRAVLEMQLHTAEPLGADEADAVCPIDGGAAVAAPDWVALMAQWVHTTGR